jgi:hypothetical protein
MSLKLIACLAAIFLASCSMQKSKVDSRQTDRSEQSAEKTAARDGAQERSSLKVDYLTPISAIKNPEIYVYKEKRRLYIVQSKVLVRDYPIGLGPHPNGDKEKDGDGRTPEGDFIICTKDQVSGVQKSLGLSYPDKKHAERAYFSGILNPVEFRDILFAAEHKNTPPWKTKLGGKVSIHAGGAQRDWTDGSIALYDSDMGELYQIADLGTPVTIRP